MDEATDAVYKERARLFKAEKRKRATARADKKKERKRLRKEGWEKKIRGIREGQGEDGVRG